MTEEEHHRHANIEVGTSGTDLTSEKPLTVIASDHRSFKDTTDRLGEVEQSETRNDRKGQIELFLMDHDLFGFEPYSPELLDDLTAQLLDKETSYREAVPDFDVTADWSERRILRFFERKYVANQKLDEAADKDEVDRDRYQEAVNRIRERSPNIDNLSLCRRLIRTHGADIPPEHVMRLQAFVQMQELAIIPDDANLISGKINRLDISSGFPSPAVFAESEILSDDRFSEDYKDVVARKFNIPRARVKTGGQVDQTLDARDDNGEPLYTQAHPIEISDGTHAYEKPDGTRAVLVSVDGSRRREIPWNRNDAPDIIGMKISLAKIWARNEWGGHTDFFGESVNIETHILSETDPQKLTKVRNTINAIFGGTRGFDAVIVQDNEADFVGWFNQYLATKGDASIGDFDKDTAVENRRNLGLHPSGDFSQVDYDVLREAALFAKDQYGQGEPNYYALQRHLHKIFPEKNIPLTGENGIEVQSEYTV